MAENDRRYRIMVNLVRTDRPRYWTWHCPHCQFPGGEMVNTEIASMTDLMDMGNLEKAMVGHRCGGRSPIGRGRCDFWFYFNLADKPVMDKKV